MNLHIWGLLHYNDITNENEHNLNANLYTIKAPLKFK